LLKDAAVFLLVTGLLLAVVEAGAHFLVAAETRDALRLVTGDDAVSQTLAYLEINLAPLDKDVDFLWRNHPNTDKRQLVNPQRFGRQDEWTIVSNARGFRATEPLPPEKPSGEFRILCIGDSVTFGFNVDQSDSYPERLQAALRARFPGRPIRVINAGTPGWSWLQGVLFLEREGLALHPDLVIMAHGANDRFFAAKITDAERIGELRRPGVRWVESARLLLERTSTYRLVQRWFAPSTNGKSDLSPACQKQLAKEGKCTRVGLDEIEAAVAAANGLARNAGADLLVLNLDFEQTDAVIGVRAAVLREQVPFVDVVADYLKRRAADESARERRLGLAPTRIQPSAEWRQAGPTRVLFRVLVPPGASSVRVDGVLELDGTKFGAELHDDGTAGDEAAGDGVWSGRLEARPNGVLDYRFSRDGVNELTGLPPLASTHETRKHQVLGDTILPVEVFGDLYLLAEGMHPNADGQELVAESVLDTLPKLQSFVRWTALDHAGTVERH